ncbi:hypothetical protein EJ04DRAFT_577113 [Polyplosphaeria fusca]|uniref:Uncharacterized protein n=1 Tax=Polyplosphaeria fusca TaxID=682080 RepID=A0A9P4UZG6_9PLEO|nr:hypothetical protein EJ04DRAFT_577113 [Polyplosphaeria fusca]
MAEERGQKRLWKLSLKAWTIILVAFCERFCFYGILNPLQNYLQLQDEPGNGKSGIGLGQSRATALSYVFTVLYGTMPIVGGILADGRIGPRKTVSCALVVYTLGVMVLVLTSSPIATSRGAKLGGFILAILLLGPGIGWVRPNWSAWLGAQCQADHKHENEVEKTSTGSESLEMLLQHAYSVLYWMANAGALSGIATTLIEKHVGFWLAFLLPLIGILTSMVLFFTTLDHQTLEAREKSGLRTNLKIVWKGITSGFDLEKVKNEQDAAGAMQVTNVQDALRICRIFVCFVPFMLCMSQVNNNLISQAGQMQTYGVPNDLLFNLNPIFCVILIPCLDKGLYPLLRHFNIPFGSMARIKAGLAAAALTMLYTLGIQIWIYKSPPCYRFALDCSPSAEPNHVKVFVQIPTYALLALSEIFCVVSAMSYAFEHSPDSMKSLVQALFMSTEAVSALIGIALSPLAQNPRLLVLYGVLSGVVAVNTVVFAVIY